MQGNEIGSPVIETLNYSLSDSSFLDTGLVLNESEYKKLILHTSKYQDLTSEWNQVLNESDFELVHYLQMQASEGKLQRKSQADCIKSYNNPIQSKFRNIVAVSEAVQTDNHSLLWLEKTTPLSDNATDWTCKYTWGELNTTTGESTCSSEDAISNSTNWAIGYHHRQPFNTTHSSIWSYSISYCLVEPGPPDPCALSYDRWLLSVVIVANAVKIALMVITLKVIRGPTLVTLGDGLSSFLERPDPNTEGMCLFTEKDFHGDYFRSTGDTRKPWVAKAKTYTKKDYWARNFSSPSELEWFISITM